MSKDHITLIRETGVVPVVAIPDAELAVDLAHALLAGGVRVIEMTLRTEAGLESMRKIAEKVPDMLVGAGTLLSVSQLKASFDAGAVFGVAPGCDPDLVQAANECGLTYAPGVMTPTDIAKALGLGCRLLKYFPAETAGGAPHLKALIAPHAHLGVQFIPTGGISLANMGNYLKLPAVPAVGGSWLTPKTLLEERDWSAITKIAKEAREAVEASR
ncbi:MAG: bifunctional 4-hydroxy-2-oxoglutarate aldolase/2-dehydro-3-deoxy-phosphogluconate aldolase [Opitutales bacterium]